MHETRFDIQSATDRQGNPWVRHSDGTYHAPECGPGCPDGIDLFDPADWYAPLRDVVYVGEVAA